MGIVGKQGGTRNKNQRPINEQKTFHLISKHKSVNKTIKYQRGKNSKVNNFIVIKGVEEWALSFTADGNEHWYSSFER